MSSSRQTSADRFADRAELLPHGARQVARLGGGRKAAQIPSQNRCRDCRAPEGAASPLGSFRARLGTPGAAGRRALPRRQRLPALYCPARSPLDAWLGLEDLCWRLSHCGVHIQFVGITVRLCGFHHAELPHDLRAAVANPDTYAWWVDLEHGSVVSTLMHEGTDLVMILPGESQIHAWPEAETLMQLSAAFGIAWVRRGLQ